MTPNYHSKYSKRYYHSACIACESKAYRSTEKGRRAVAATKKRTVATYKANKRMLKLKLMEAIGQTQCKSCGYSDPAAICFHHRDPKEKGYEISYGFTHYYSFETLLPEVRKCDAYCMNCHTILHRRESKKSTLWSKFKQLLMFIIGQKSCVNCDCTDLRCLSFHHRDPKEKLFKIADSINSSVTLEETIAEVKKCDIYCMNCHCIFHAKEYEAMKNATTMPILEGTIV